MNYFSVRRENGRLIAGRSRLLDRRVIERGNPKLKLAQLVRAGEFRSGRKTLVILQGFVRQLDGLLELRVVAFDDQIGALRNDKVWIDAVIFDGP